MRCASLRRRSCRICVAIDLTRPIQRTPHRPPPTSTEIPASLARGRPARTRMSAQLTTSLAALSSNDMHAHVYLCVHVEITCLNCPCILVCMHQRDPTSNWARNADGTRTSPCRLTHTVAPCHDLVCETGQESTQTYKSMPLCIWYLNVLDLDAYSPKQGQAR